MKWKGKIKILFQKCECVVLMHFRVIFRNAISNTGWWNLAPSHSHIYKDHTFTNYNKDVQMYIFKARQIYWYIVKCLYFNNESIWKIDKTYRINENNFLFCLITRPFLDCSGMIDTVTSTLYWSKNFCC